MSELHKENAGSCRSRACGRLRSAALW